MVRKKSRLAPVKPNLVACPKISVNLVCNLMQSRQWQILFQYSWTSQGILVTLNLLKNIEFIFEFFLNRVDCEENLGNAFQQKSPNAIKNNLKTS